MSDITKRFSDGAKRIITAAMLAARELGHSYIGSEHILLGILNERESTPARLLTERGVCSEIVRKKIIGLVGMGCKTTLSADDMTPICRRIVLKASILAGACASPRVEAEHILMALLGEECVAVRIIEELGGDCDELFAILDELYNEESIEHYCEPEKSEYKRVNEVATPLLDANSFDLTEKAKNGKIDPVIGREAEEERLIAVLLRRSKNNPCLVGEAGVGKTAIVESLAMRIVNGSVPEELLNVRIKSLELSMVVAGTKYRGEFEEKIKNILSEVRAAGDIILFIDEIHTIVGAGGAEGAIDASNILKPALARGEIRLIGATTLAEFRSSIEKDKALERRFQQINVPEPSERECVSMLFGLRKRYEQYHKITITDEAILSAVTLSNRYICDRYLPDKAIDLIDEAAAFLKLTSVGLTQPKLTEAEIALVCEKRTGIPISKINQAEAVRLSGLEAELKKQIIGQDSAVETLCLAVKRARSGVREGGRPNASFLFIGKAGVGKTECAKALAKAVFNSDKAFIRLDMSEYSEQHSVSKLIGSPPGYVGYNESNSLTERVRRSPYSLLLFDEIEKAHPDVRALLLQILDEGTLTDSAGRTVRFDNTMLILTANGSSNSGIGFASEGGAVDTASKMFAPELVDRVDEIIYFSSLGKEELCNIVNNRLADFCARMQLKGVGVELSPDFAEKVYHAVKSKSARAVSRFALRAAEEAVSDLLLNNEGFNQNLTILMENGRGIAKIKQNTY